MPLQLRFRALTNCVFLPLVLAAACSGDVRPTPDTAVSANDTLIPQKGTISPGTGLEVTDYRTVQFVINALGTEGTAIGLASDDLRTKVELRLRQAGLTPVSEGRLEFLRVIVAVSGNGYDVVVDFMRPVTYDGSGGSRTRVGSTWGGMFLGGSHGGSATAIMGTLDTNLNRFLNEYLRANQP